MSAAPTPVVTPHPMSASCSLGRSVSTFTSDASSAVMRSANVPSPVIPNTDDPSSRIARVAIMSSLPRSHRFDSS